MGAQESKLNESLIGWWYLLKHKETLMFGPQMAFHLRSPDGKTILIFGEDHKHVNIPPCGEDQKTFTELYKELLKNEICEKMQVVLELSVWSPEESLNINQTNKILDLLTNYYKIYRRKESCIINLQFSNPDKYNSRLVEYIRTIDQYIYHDRILSKDYIYKMYDDIRTMFIMSQKNINTTIDTILNSFNENDKLHVKKLTDKSSIDMDETIEKLRSAIINPNSTLHDISELIFKCYKIILRTIDVYAIIAIIGNKINSIVYMGALHSAYVVSFLISKCGYHLMDIGSTVSDFCIKFDDDAFDNKYIKLKRFIMNKNEPQKSYLLECFKDIETTLKID